MIASQSAHFTKLGKEVGKTPPPMKPAPERTDPQLWLFASNSRELPSSPKNSHYSLCRVEEKSVWPSAKGKIKLTQYQI